MATAGGGRQPGQRRGLVLAVSALTLTAVVVAGVAATQRGAAPAVTADSQGESPPVEFPEPGVEHVHGLGVDPGESRWDRRARLAMADFAVSPDHPELVLATTPRGLRAAPTAAAPSAPRRRPRPSSC